MKTPTIHLNGTGAEELLTDYRDAMETVRDAEEKLSATSPNARDYYTQAPGSWETARAEHYARVNKLQSVYDELLQLAIHCHEIITEREQRQAERTAP